MAEIGKLGWVVKGGFFKVHLPGESPWAECVAVHPEGHWDGRIANRLVGEMPAEERLQVAQHCFPGAQRALPSLHGYRENQVVRFKRFTDAVGGFEIWVPAEGADIDWVMP